MWHQKHWVKPTHYPEFSKFELDVYTNWGVFLQKICPRIMHCGKKTEFTSSNDELVSDFNKPFVRESDNRENFIVWSRSWRCIMIAFVHILKCQLSSLSSCWKNWNHIWRSRETISKSQLRAVLWHNNNQMFRHVGRFNCAPLQTEKINLGNSSCVNMHSVWTAALIGEKGESEKYF